MKAIINEDFLMLYLKESEIENDAIWDIDYDCLTEFNVGDEVEILKEIEIGQYAKRVKSYVIYNPKNHESVTIAETFLKFI